MTSGLPVLIEVFWKSGAVLGVALCLNVLLRRKSADLRRLVLSTAIVAMLVAGLALPMLPRLTAVLPAWPHVQSANIPVVVKPAVASPIPDGEPEFLPVSNLSPRPSHRMPAPIPLFWFAGASLLLVRFAIRLRGLHRLRNASTAANGTAPGVTLLQNELIAAPVTWGIFRHVILLPTSFEQLPAESRNAVLSHELAHVEAHDFLLRVLSEIARALLWFQPLVWIARRQLREEQELACDNRVLAAGEKPSAYAKLLLDWESRLPKTEALPAVGMVQRGSLTRRLHALLDQNLRRDVVSRKGVLVTLFLGLAATLPLAALSFIPWTPPPTAHAQTTITTPIQAAPVQIAQARTAQVRTPPPAPIQPKSPTAVIVLVLDKSASMEGFKIRALRSAAGAVIDSLRPEDQIGILIFDHTFQWAVPIGKADDKASMKNLLAGIEPDGGTQIPKALTEAYSKILSANATFRHIVLLTDGISEEGDSEQLAKDAPGHNVTISTIGLGEQEVNRPFLEKIATEASGQSYFLNDPAALEQIMLRDVKEHTGAAAIR